MTGNGPERKRLPQLFKPGQSGNPAGRKPGSRNKLSEDFIRAYADDFAAHGSSVIAEVRISRPVEYLKIGEKLARQTAKLELDVSVGPSHELRTAMAEYLHDWNAVRDTVRRIGADPKILDAITLDDDD
jgi:hypothetical protein